jgi:hypothetical protein
MVLIEVHDVASSGIAVSKSAEMACLSRQIIRYRMAVAKV